MLFQHIVQVIQKKYAEISEYLYLLLLVQQDAVATICLDMI